MKKNLFNFKHLIVFILSLFCLNSNLIFAQGVEIKDVDDNTLMKVEDEGLTGSIFLNSGTAPTVTLNKLYNLGGILNWNGNSLGSPLWIQNGSDLYYNSGKVGIGTTTPTAGLNVAGIDGALFTGSQGYGIIPVEGAGVRMMWYPRKGAFRAGIIDGDQWDDVNIGNNSFATGYNTTASGQYSTASGLASVASGLYSTAMGANTIASGSVSTSLGANNIASGVGSIAMGFWTTASGDYSTTIGNHIEASGEFSVAIGLSDTDSIVTQSNTMAIIGGKVGIGAVSPSSDLHVAGIDGALFTGTFTSGTIPMEGAGTRMMWYPKKAAFRVGLVDGTEWDDALVGYYSFATGRNTTASGEKSTAMGSSTEASGDYSTALGLGTLASGGSSTAMGSGTTASGTYSTAMGQGTIASEGSATAMGSGTLATNYASTAMGSYTNASGWISTAMGSYTTASAQNSTAMGYFTTASGDYSTAMGRGIEASGEYTLAISLSNQGGVSVTQDNTMAIMGGLVGIGTVAPLRKFEVHDDINSYVSLFKNSENSIGDGIRITLQPLNPTTDNRYADFMRNGGTEYAGWICGNGAGQVIYSTTSDARLKANIEDYQGALDKVSKIKVKQYEMISAPGKEQIGFLAQELLEIYPQAVSGDPNGNVDEEPMGVDYGRLTPLLVKAIQEQQEIIAQLQTEIELLKNSNLKADNSR